MRRYERLCISDYFRMIGTCHRYDEAFELAAVHCVVFIVYYEKCFTYSYY